MVFALQEELGTEKGTVLRVANQLGYGVESVLLWVKQAEIDRASRSGMTSAEDAENKRLRHRECAGNGVTGLAGYVFLAGCDARRASLQR